MLNRHEVSSYEELKSLPEFPACKPLFWKAGWRSFFRNLKGYDDDVALEFAQSFDEETTQVGTLKFEVTEESIGLATKLPCTGEKWGKHHKVPKMLFQHLFLPEYRDSNSSKGFSEHWLHEKYRGPLQIIN